MAMSAAHRAAISAGMKRYWANKKGGNSSVGNSANFKNIVNIDTNRVISREEAAKIMFGTKVATAKIAKRKKSRRR